MTRISVVIPTLNDGETLDECLSSIRDCQQDLEIIIVDGGSSDQTVEIAEQYNCEIIFENKGTISYAREQGVKTATGDYIAFTDADCVVPSNWISGLLAYFDENGKVAAVGGPNVTPPDDSPFAKSVGDTLSFLSRAGSRYGKEGGKVREIHHNPTCNVIYRKEVIIEVDGFSDDLVTVDDEEMDYRIRNEGYKILYTPNIEVLHYRRPTIKSFTKMAYRYGVGRGQVIKRHPQMGRWFHFVPSILIGFLAVLLGAGSTNKLGIQYFLGMGGSGAAGIMGMSSYLSWQSKRMKQIPTYATLITIWFWGWGIGFIMGLFRY